MMGGVNVCSFKTKLESNRYGDRIHKKPTHAMDLDIKENKYKLMYYLYVVSMETEDGIQKSLHMRWAETHK